MKEREWIKYLEKYEENYKLNLEEIKKTTPSLVELFDRFNEEIYKLTENYKLMVKIKGKIENELDLKGEKKRLFEYWQVCEDNILNDTILYSFIYGYSLSTKLKEESERVTELLQNKSDYI